MLIPDDILYAYTYLYYIVMILYIVSLLIMCIIYLWATRSIKNIYNDGHKLSQTWKINEIYFLCHQNKCVYLYVLRYEECQSIVELPMGWSKFVLFD